MACICDHRALAVAIVTVAMLAAAAAEGGLYPTLPPLVPKAEPPLGKPVRDPSLNLPPGICVVYTKNPNATHTGGVAGTANATATAVSLKSQAEHNATASLVVTRECCEGYRRARPLGPLGRCEPVCPGGCPAGSNCTAPGLCSCLGNKIHDLGGNCVDTCPHSCLNGVCTGGGVGTCTCTEGFRPAEGGRLCAPHCEACAGLGGNCTAPSVCQCLPGFVKDLFGRCVPSCRGGCVNADCTAPDQCTCQAGFSRSAARPNECESLCPAGCVNARCTAPGGCECLPGHVKDPQDAAGRRCVPHCPDGCVNGDCTAPDFCSCRPGFAPAASSRRVCEARCSPPCVNGDCLQSGTCSCHPGHVKDPQDTTGSRCVPHCPGGCGKSGAGRCVAPGQCACEPGYSNMAEVGAANGSAACHPVCTEGCVNADCTAPNECTCRQGYRKDPTALAGNRCIPVCPEGCINGDCVSPGKCECRPGFRRDVNDPRGRTCVSDCLDGCPNGVCRGPNDCACLDGFAKSPLGRCEPSCPQGCFNADCTGPNVCTCRQGYQKEQGGGAANICKPKCSLGCENGVCSGPELCLCKAGFKKDKSNKGKCIPL